MLTAPLIHNPDFEQFPSKEIVASCYVQDHRAPAPGCRCGLYVAIEGTLDSLAGYLLDSAHDRDPAVYAEVACTGRVFVDRRGVRAERIRILRLAASPSGWPDPDAYAEAVAGLCQRYDVAVCDLDVVPEWVLSNVMPQGAPTNDSTVDLDALILSRSRCPVLAALPSEFLRVSFSERMIPGRQPELGLTAGSNCQRYAYAVLRHFGRSVPDLRSSDLWADEELLTTESEPEPLDLALFAASPDPWGAHVGVYLGGAAVLHLCKEIGLPVVWDLQGFAQRERYATLIGFKRVRPLYRSR